MKTAIKQLLGRTIFASRLDGLLLRKAAVIVAFHRVHEAAAPDDSLSVNVEMFERHCRFFQRHFRVVRLADIVEKLERGQPFRRELAITFDDGYRDNFEHAAPILEKLGLPATFFVVTSWMGTSVVPSMGPFIRFEMNVSRASSAMPAMSRYHQKFCRRS